MKLLLFDIDLTLISTGGAGKRAMEKSFARLFRVPQGMNGVSFAGRTDRAILKDALANNRLPWSEENERLFKEDYFRLLESELREKRNGQRILPGIADLLPECVAQPNLRLGLLTGNWRRGAEIKLSNFDLFHYFELGAFADDSEFRNELPAIAARRFQDKTGEPLIPGNMFIIGDTPLDVECAKAYGARSIAVATGFFSEAQLQEARPDHLFANLTDHDRFMKIVNGKS